MDEIERLGNLANEGSYVVAGNSHYEIRPGQFDKITLDFEYIYLETGPVSAYSSQNENYCVLADLLDRDTELA